MNSKKISAFVFGVACFVALLLSAPLTTWAQQAAGSITGTVTDPSGSAVPNASITASDVNQGTTWTTKTGSAGIYEFPQIPAGNIEVTVQAAGFAAQQRAAFALVAEPGGAGGFRAGGRQGERDGQRERCAAAAADASTEVGTVLDAKL